MGIIKDPTSWRTGFELGLAGFSFPYSKPRKPTAYLYNGIRLPALPEWDKETYPYAYILKNIYAADEGYEYGLVLRKKKPTVPNDNHDVLFTAIDILHKCIDGAWTEGVLNTTFLWGISGVVMWSNVDVYYQDGTLCLAASEPVPVYE